MAWANTWPPANNAALAALSLITNSRRLVMCISDN
jgi:hypothetical protein